MNGGITRALERSRAEESLDDGDVLAILRGSDDDLEPVLDRAHELRDAYTERIGTPGVVTYSRKVFVPLTFLCRYRCSYCTFVTPRATPGTEYRTMDEVLGIAIEGRRWGATEALFTLGESPEHRHPEARAWLDAHGYASTVEYLIDAARAVTKETGLLPHANPGAVTEDEMRRLRDVAASQGVMMEQLSDRLLRTGEAHAGAPGKAAAVRLGQLELAAATRTPFTTGFLIGIGETLEERAHTITAIAGALSDEALPQIQEVIVQNFRAKPDTPMRGTAEPSEEDMVRAIAATRLAVGDRTSVQAPPNLTPVTYGRYLDAGINDWGGVSPVTPDHVNPEMPWPRIDELHAECARRGFALRQRLPVYPHYVTDERALATWVAPAMRRHVLAAGDGMGLAREERWYAGEGWTPVLRAAQPEPKRKALAMADAKPASTAEEVSVAFAARVRPGGYGAPPPLENVGFDEMLPEMDGRTVLPWECADLSQRSGASHKESLRSILNHPWIGPYIVKGTRPSRVVADLLERAHQGERLDVTGVERLFRAEGADLDALFRKADAIRREVVGDEVSYVVNRNITYTNFCHTGCTFCGFARPLGHDDGYYFEPHQVGAKAREAWELGATEVCVQGGIHPHNTGEIYLEIARAIRDAAPQIHLHGFSPLEITVGAQTLGLPLDRYIAMLKDAGLGSIPGTAAEILDTRVRPKITPQKLSADDWIALMRTAHEAGIRSTTTIMFGHVDDPQAWAIHLLRLRDLQASTGGFTEFVPLPFVHHRTPMFMRGASRTGPTWRECLKIHAVGRVVLHPHITNVQASWVKMGMDGVLAALDVGVNDFGGTLGEEHISRLAGASHGLGHSVDEIEAAIRSVGRTPVERTTTYERPRRGFRERAALGARL